MTSPGNELREDGWSARLGLLATAAMGLCLCTCTKGAPATRGTAVKVVGVERSNTTTSTRYSAQIVPATRVDLAFKVGGYVESIARTTGVDNQPRAIQEGDRVDANAPLASIRKTEYQQKVAEARAAVSQAYATYHQARLDSGRDAKLAKSGSLPLATADLSRTRKESAAAALQEAQIRLDQSITALADATLTSPMSGVVIKRAIEIGSLAAPGTVAFSIADVTNVKAVFGVPDFFLSRIQLGALQMVTTDAFPGVEFEGHVSRLAPSADLKSRVFEVDVTIPNPDNKLKPGMVAALSIDQTAIKANENVLYVPLTAVVRSATGTGFAVFVIESAGGVTVARARPIELGDYLGSVIPVEKGLNSNDRVVVQGAGLLSDGERVEIIP